MILGLSLAAGAGEGEARAAVGSASVRATAAGLSLEAKRVPLDQVLRAISAEAGIEVRGRLPDNPEVDVSFATLDYSEAFRRVLGERSFLLVYGEDGRPRAIQLLGAGVAAGEPVAAPPAPPPAPGSGPAPDEVSPNAPPLPGTDRGHPLQGRLASAMGQSKGSFNQLVSLAARTDDAGLRREALQRVMGVIEAEPELKTYLLATVERSSTDQLAKYIVGAAGPRAENVAIALVEVVAEGPARTRAEAVARQVRLIQRR